MHPECGETRVMLKQANRVTESEAMGNVIIIYPTVFKYLHHKTYCINVKRKLKAESVQFAFWDL